MNFHTLDSVTDGHRLVDFAVADLGELMPGDKPSVLDSLEKLLETPPRCKCDRDGEAESAVLHFAAIRLLMPHLLRIAASPHPEAIAQEAMELCFAEPINAMDGSNVPELEQRAGKGALFPDFWGSAELDGMRLRLVLARWCSVSNAFRRSTCLMSSTEDR